MFTTVGMSAYSVVEVSEYEYESKLLYLSDL